MVLQEAIRQREEASMNNSIDSRSIHFPCLYKIISFQWEQRYGIAKRIWRRQKERDKWIGSNVEDACSQSRNGMKTKWRLWKIVLLISWMSVTKNWKYLPSLTNNATGLSCGVFLKGRQKGRRARPRIKGYWIVFWDEEQMILLNELPEFDRRFLSGIITNLLKVNRVFETNNTRFNAKYIEWLKILNESIKDGFEESTRNSTAFVTVSKSSFSKYRWFLVLMKIEKTRSAFSVYRTSRKGSKSSYVSYRNEQCHPHGTHESGSGRLTFLKCFPVVVENLWRSVCWWIPDLRNLLSFRSDEADKHDDCSDISEWSDCKDQEDSLVLRYSSAWTSEKNVFNSVRDRFFPADSRWFSQEQSTQEGGSECGCWNHPVRCLCEINHCNAKWDDRKGASGSMGWFARPDGGRLTTRTQDFTAEWRPCEKSWVLKCLRSWVEKRTSDFGSTAAKLRWMRLLWRRSIFRKWWAVRRRNWKWSTNAACKISSTFRPTSPSFSIAKWLCVIGFFWYGDGLGYERSVNIVTGWTMRISTSCSPNWIKKSWRSWPSAAKREIWGRWVWENKQFHSALRIIRVRGRKATARQQRRTTTHPLFNKHKTTTIMGGYS